MNDRLISANKLKAHYAWWNDENKSLFDEIVDAQPTVEAELIKHGKWIEQEDGSGWCSLCGCSMPMFIIDWQYQYDKTPYCPSCGAKLITDDEEEKEAETDENNRC